VRFDELLPDTVIIADLPERELVGRRVVGAQSFDAGDAVAGEEGDRLLEECRAGRPPFTVEGRISSPFMRSSCAIRGIP
jgi:hypothetical protein